MFYQQAIFDEKLNWWSDARRDYLTALSCQSVGAEVPPAPTPDINERLILSAYSRYRILLLHAVRGYQPEAQTVYDALQEKFPSEVIGHSYAELASVFWNEYLAGNNTGAACVKALQYAVTHEDEVLLPLGGAFYKTWDRYNEYKSGDICPFK